jgi:hypothetical protein
MAEMKSVEQQEQVFRISANLINALLQINYVLTRINLHSIHFRI